MSLINGNFRQKLRSSATSVKFGKRSNFPKNEREIYFFKSETTIFRTAEKFFVFVFDQKENRGEKTLNFSEGKKLQRPHSFSIIVMETASVLNIYIYLFMRKTKALD